MELFYILDSVIIVSLLSLLGALFIVIGTTRAQRFISVSIAVSTGVMLANVFFDLLPESIELLPDNWMYYVLGGFLTFFVLEKILSWHHHIEGDHHDKEKPVAYLALVGDGIHNFVDGV